MRRKTTMRLQEFKDGKIAPWAETKEDTKRFIDAMKAAGMPWIHGAKYEPTDCDFVKCEYGYGIQGNAMGRVSERGWYSHQNVPGKPFASITVAEFFEDTAKYTMADFKAGKVVATFPNKEARDAFLKRPELAHSAHCVCVYARCMSHLLTLWSTSSGTIHAELEGSGNLPTVPYTDLLPRVPDEQITAYRNPDGTVTCDHRLDGRVVKSATVKRYYKDADDLPTAAKHALEKMLGKPDEYKIGDKVGVHWSDVHSDKEKKNVIGIVAKINGARLWPYVVQFPDGTIVWCARGEDSEGAECIPDYIIGLAEETV